MTLEEAIEIKENYLKLHASELYTQIYRADRLSIEALKRCKERSDRFPNLPHLRLPGETKD